MAQGASPGATGGWQRLRAGLHPRWARSEVAQQFALRVSGEALRDAGLDGPGPALDDIERSLSWRVVELYGHEGVDELFEYRLRLKRSRAFDPDGLWEGARMTGRMLDVHIALPGGGQQERWAPSSWGWEAGWRVLHGLVSEAYHVGWDERDDEYELVLVPWLYVATLRSDCRIYQDLRIDELLDRVLGAYPWRVRWELRASYPRRDYQVQYHESDFAFFERIAQEWGIHYHFEHRVGDCELVLGDGNEAFVAGRSPLYERLQCLQGEGEPTEGPEPAYGPRGANPEAIERMDWCLKLVAGQWSGADYDYLRDHERPGERLQGHAWDPLPTAYGELGGWHWRGDAGFDAAQPDAGHGVAYGQPSGPEQATMLARIRLQEQRQQFERARGGGALRGLQSGQRLRTHGHWMAQCNGEFVVLRTRLHLREGVAPRLGEEPGAPAPAPVVEPWEWANSEELRHWHVRCDFELQPADVRVCPLRTHRRPRIGGVQTAWVVGRTPFPACNPHEPCVDALGRIRVRFPWDREGPHDERASCWVRVLTPASGDVYGQVFVPRAGQEVVVAFVDGDCDTPVVIGALYSEDNQPPWELPMNAALSGVRTREWGSWGPNGEVGRSNQLVFDDTPGQLQAQLASEQAHSQLSLGVLSELRGREGRGHALQGRWRGEGLELRSDGEGVLRAARGLLLSTHPRRRAVGAMLELAEPLQRLRQAQQAWLRALEQRDGIDLSDPIFDAEEEAFQRFVREHRARMRGQAQGAPEASSPGAPAASAEPASELASELASEHASELPPESAADGAADPAQAHPPLDGQLLVAAAGPLLAACEGPLHLAAGQALALSAGSDVDVHAGGGLLMSARRGLRVLARKAGLFLVARAGLVDLRAPRGDIELQGQQVQVVSQDGWLHIIGKQELVIEAQGTRLRLSDEGIELDTPGAFTVQAPSHEFGGPASLRQVLAEKEQARAVPPESTPPEPAKEQLRHIVPIVFLPGIMGSNLRMTRERQKRLERKDNRAWRPDDLGIATALGMGEFGRFLKNAKPHQRQLNFDPDTTELDRYEGTDDPQQFDAKSFDDDRHDNVPSATSIAPLLVDRPWPWDESAFSLVWPKAQYRLNGASKARRRGWSEVLWGDYGTVLTELEDRMNNLVEARLPADKPPRDPLQVTAHWESRGGPLGAMRRFVLHDKLNPVGRDPSTWGTLRHGPAPTLQEADVLGLADTVYPVHAMGYNWLRPNAESAQCIARRIEQLIAHYAELGKARGVQCDHVMLVTHSMGGIVARAVAHAKMGALPLHMLGGVAFTVMPTYGAGTTYKRMRAGMKGEGGFKGWLVVNDILGPTAEHAVPVIANASGPLELYPAGDYGNDWLRVRWTDTQGGQHQHTLDLERAISDPNCWWRAINPDWINPANQVAAVSSFVATRERIRKAAVFHCALKNENPIPRDVAIFCSDKAQKTWGQWFGLPQSAFPFPSAKTLLDGSSCGTMRMAEFRCKAMG